jgi:uncharacterized protein YqgC (DUF456 family)
MEILLVILAFVLLILGILGAVVPGLPGPPLSFLGLLVMKFSGRADFTLVFLLVWAGITIIVTVMDYVLPSIMARKFGGSKAAAVGSFLGLIAGIFILPPWGMLVGPFVGAFIGELIHNSKDKATALKTAFGAFLAFIVGSGAKLITSSLMLFYSIKA